MKLADFYKNFNMGREIDIAGTFIYNGIRNFDNLDGFSEECDLFHVLYPLSVGIERLQKVLLVLLEEFSVEVNEDSIESFEKSLITHSHQDLHARIIAKIKLEFNAHQNEFLQLLTQFYETCRYDRFNLSPNFQKERDLFVSFLSKRLSIDIRVDTAFMDTPNDNRIKKFIGRIVGGIARTYYTTISDRARELNLYTYELRYDSSAYKLFLSELKKDSFHELLFGERIALAEFLVYLINYDSEEGLRCFINSIEPLELDLDETKIYFNGISKGKVPTALVDAVECRYEEMDNPLERLKMMDVLSSKHFFIE